MEITGGVESDWGSILQTEGGTRTLRFPAIQFYPGTYNLHVQQSSYDCGDSWDCQYGLMEADAGFVQGGTYAVTIRITANTLSVYVDGELIGTESGPGTLIAQDALVYVVSPWYYPANVRLRNIQYTFFSDVACPTPVPTPTPTVTSSPPTQLPTPSPTPTTEFTVAPDLLVLSATKPDNAVGKLYLVNLNDEIMNGTIWLQSSLRSAVDASSCSIVPGAFSVEPGALVEIDVTVPSAGLVPNSYDLAFGVAARTPNSLLVNQTYMANLNINAKAVASMTQVVIKSPPMVGGD